MSALVRKKITDVLQIVFWDVIVIALAARDSFTPAAKMLLVAGFIIGAEIGLAAVVLSGTIW